MQLTKQEREIIVTVITWLNEDTPPIKQAVDVLKSLLIQNDD